MDRLVALNVFRNVVDEKSFAGAALRSGLSRSAVSKNIRELEEHLGVTLVRRTTRSINVTDAGANYYERICRLLDDLQTADDTVSEDKDDPSGHLRISAPMSMGLLCVTPLLPEFLATYPNLSVDMVLNDAKVDLLRGHFDVAIRGSGQMEDSSTIARCIGESEHIICAAPSYLEDRGAPVHPEDLRHHSCLIYTGARQADRWEFQDQNAALSVMVGSRFGCNNSLALRQAAMEGHGVIRIPEVYVAQDLIDGKLVRLLKEWPTQSLGIWVMYPEVTFMPRRLRVFIDYIVKRLEIKKVGDHVPGYTTEAQSPSRTPQGEGGLV